MAIKINKQFSDIVETGSNANGKYIKYKDGTLIQQGVVKLPANADKYTLDFPAYFATRDYSLSVIWWYQWYRIMETTYSAQVNGSIDIFPSYWDSSADKWIYKTDKEPTFHWTAIGKWK